MTHVLIFVPQWKQFPSSCSTRVLSPLALYCGEFHLACDLIFTGWYYNTIYIVHQGVHDQPVYENFDIYHDNGHQSNQAWGAPTAIVGWWHLNGKYMAVLPVSAISSDDKQLADSQVHWFTCGSIMSVLMDDKHQFYSRSRGKKDTFPFQMPSSHMWGWIFAVGAPCCTHKFAVFHRKIECL